VPEVSRRDLVVSLLLAVACGLVTLGLDTQATDDRLVDVWAVLLVVASGLATVVRRPYPVPVLAACTVATTAYLFAGYPYGPVFFPFMLALYSVARYRPPARSWLPSALALLAMVSHVLVHPSALPGWAGLVPGAAWVVLPYAAGVTRRVLVEGAERARAEALRQGVYDERLRVAQEVHDVVGHGLAAIRMQADITLHVLDRDPQRGRAALEAISRSAGAAMEELRSTLQLVQRADAPLSPSPGLAEVGALCDRLRDAGVDVSLAVTGESAGLSPAADLAAYRVVQESLTNVVRHAAAPRASVAVAWSSDAVSLRVASPGGAAPSSGGGLGVEGMRARVLGVGGTFSAGPVDEEFVVSARIPVTPDRQEES